MENKKPERKNIYLSDDELRFLVNKMDRLIADRVITLKEIGIDYKTDATYINMDNILAKALKAIKRK